MPNVTSPLKQNALQLCNSLSDYARSSGSVNTILIQDFNNYSGDNTDSRGFIADLVNRQGFSFANKKVLVFGAGGAARGIIDSILVHQPAEIVVANRTLAKAEHLKQKWPIIEAAEYSSIPDKTFDIVIDTRLYSESNSLQGPTKISLAPDAFAYTINYGARAMPFLDWCQQFAFIHKSDGLGMLVAQAAYSFQIWTGFFPQWEKVLTSSQLTSVGRGK